MKLITYAEAAGILNVSVQTLKQALEPDRNALTKAGRRGTNGLLIEEQVRLFMGNNQRTGKKKRLSLLALSPEEQVKWKRYAQEARQVQSPDAVTVSDVIARQLAPMLAPIQEAVSDIASSVEKSRALRKQAEEVENEGFRKALSLLRTRADTSALAI